MFCYSPLLLKTGNHFKVWYFLITFEPCFPLPVHHSFICVTAWVYLNSIFVAVQGIYMSLLGTVWHEVIASFFWFLCTGLSVQLSRLVTPWAPQGSFGQRQHPWPAELWDPRARQFCCVQWISWEKPQCMRPALCHGLVHRSCAEGSQGNR